MKQTSLDGLYEVGLSKSSFKCIRQQGPNASASLDRYIDTVLEKQNIDDVAAWTKPRREHQELFENRCSGSKHSSKTCLFSSVLRDRTWRTGSIVRMRVRRGLELFQVKRREGRRKESLQRRDVRGQEKTGRVRRGLPIARVISTFLVANVLRGCRFWVAPISRDARKKTLRNTR